MLDFSDLPYEFVPPKPNLLVISLVRTLNRLIAMPGKNHRLNGVELHGAERVTELMQQGRAGFAFLPNHPTHSDPHVMMEVCRRLHLKPAFMTAYDVFARSKAGAWVMQHTGAFSVDREGSDRKSMKCAGDILAKGKYPLVLFPEGNVYLCNDRVTPFAEGAAFIALRAQRALGSDTPVYAVPVSLKYSYTEDVREQVRNALATLAKPFGTDFDPEARIVDEVRRISSSVLARHLKQRGHLPAESSVPTDEQVAHAAEQIITSLESKIDLNPRPKDDLTTRVRKIRAAVHAIRTDLSREHDHRAAEIWADEAILALRVLGYSGGYTAANPSLDRVAETVARLREDVTSKCHLPDGERRAMVEIGHPIDLREHLAAFESKARSAIANVTNACEQTVQAGVDGINSRNQLPGAQPF